MSGILQRLFGRRAETRPTAPAATAAASKTGVASALESGPEVERDYEEFCQTFCFKPGQNFMDYLASQGMERLQIWFQPGTPEPEPKSFIRLVNNATRRGIKVWEQTGVQIAIHGRWSQGGGPSEESSACLSILAQILEMPITVYFSRTEGGETLSMKFEP